MATNTTQTDLETISDEQDDYCLCDSDLTDLGCWEHFSAEDDA